MSVRDKMREITAKMIEIPISKIHDHSEFKNDLGMDSLEVVELCMEFDVEFDIVLNDKDIENIRTFSDAVDVVTAKVV